ncbi:unnamed protein product, partial [Mycena citricolor]
YPHPPTAACDFANQKSLNRAWALATAYLAWDIRPGECVSWSAAHAGLTCKHSRCVHWRYRSCTTTSCGPASVQIV